MGNCCGIFMLMYALCICTSSPPSFTEDEMPAIRRWWCIQLMDRFGIEGYGWHFRQTGTIIFAALVQARHQLPERVLMDTLEEVVLHEGDAAIFKLALVFAHGAGSQNSTENSTLTCTLLRSAFNVETSTNTAPEDMLAEEEEEN
uniref:Si:ch211-209j12.2 n=1 Tax=Nothobranchius kuhntae TaxID=321403 RepID=A0A1A8IQS2_NOTKU